MTRHTMSASQGLEISQSTDIAAARRAAKALARAEGFDETASEEVAIAVSELGSNLLKHAGQGRLMVTRLRQAGRTGIQIESVDHGPGIQDVGQALTDGFSTAGSLGYGLGAVNRLMDELQVTSQPQGRKGTQIVCKRWTRVKKPPGMICPLDIGVATRPHPMMTVNGDAFVVHHWNESALAGIIDGLGHGPPAYQAAQAARLYVETHFERPLDAIFSGVGHACRGTQGVVMALARFDWALAKLTYASVGNVESRVFRCPEKLNFTVRRGVIGLNAPAPLVSVHRWAPTQVMVLHSDGLVTRWQCEDFSHLLPESATRVAQQLLHRLARDDDDATVLVVKGVERPRNWAEACETRAAHPE